MADSLALHILMAAKRLRVWGAAGQTPDRITQQAQQRLSRREGHANARYISVDRILRCHRVGQRLLSPIFRHPTRPSIYTLTLDSPLYSALLPRRINVMVQASFEAATWLLIWKFLHEPGPLVTFYTILIDSNQYLQDAFSYLLRSKVQARASFRIIDPLRFRCMKNTEIQPPKLQTYVIKSS